MKKRSITKNQKIIVTVTDTTWHTLTQISDAPREFLIALSHRSPALIRALSSRDAQKLFKTVTLSEIAQIAIRTFLQRLASSPPNPSLPSTLGEELARALIDHYPDAYRTALQNDAAAARKARPFEKRVKRLLIKLTAAENQQFRSFAHRTGFGPSDLGGLLIERFAHQFPEYLLSQAPETKQNQNKSSTKPEQKQYRTRTKAEQNQNTLS